MFEDNIGQINHERERERGGLPASGWGPGTGVEHECSFTERNDPEFPQEWP